ncbi:hypothetical protein UFOVP59_40 [uncultured Caudovirales phage]|uniref:Uncharacterized protein n=1 Tax=uncultured Caudovirales phage TaxID=2100421 RepID=A0A6J7WW50_9CAUD|nr:hypothetical protein UFOVP59_40 [uncultured Caudovirales phage]CAB5221048.1 hypothetical protein UFOVP246_75 [uncultured Caudovirales phage]
MIIYVLTKSYKDDRGGWTMSIYRVTKHLDVAKKWLDESVFHNYYEFTV